MRPPRGGGGFRGRDGGRGGRGGGRFGGRFGGRGGGGGGGGFFRDEGPPAEVVGQGALLDLLRSFSVDLCAPVFKFAVLF